MMGYKLTIEQKENIQGVFFTDATFFNCVQDINEDWFLFLSNQDKEVLPKKYKYLLELPEAEYVPPPTPDPFDI